MMQVRSYSVLGQISDVNKVDIAQLMLLDFGIGAELKRRRGVTTRKEEWCHYTTGKMAPRHDKENGAS